MKNIWFQCKTNGKQKSSSADFMMNSFREDIKSKVSFSFELPRMFGCGEGREIYKEPRKQFKIQRARGVTRVRG